MLPIEIFEYKRKWMPGYEVKLHSDLRGSAKSWLKRLKKQEYEYKELTDNYQDTIYFENPVIGQQFESDSHFIKWVNRSANY